MGVTVALPFTLTNGTPADATQVMGNFTALVNAFASSTAESGANSSITSLSGLTTPIPVAGGGTPVYIGSNSTGSPNSQIVATTTPGGFTGNPKATVIFTAGFTNTGPTTFQVGATVAVNVFKRSFSGPVPLTGGEIHAGNLVVATYDGTQYEIVNDTPAFGILTNITAGATTDLGTVASHNVNITGASTTINFFFTSPSVDFPVYLVRFNGAYTLAYNAVSMILPSAANIVTAAGDTAVVQALGGANAQVTSYQRASGQPLTFPSALPTTGGGPFLTAGVFTYTPTANATKAHVRMVAAGGGGGASNANGTAGGNTTFGTGGTLATAWTTIGGGLGGGNSGAPGAAGTGGANGTGTLVMRRSGTRGGIFISVAIAGVGGPSFLGGAGQPVNTAAGTAADANSGSGGAGGSSGAAVGAGAGGGEFVEFWINLVGQVPVTGSIGAKGTGGAVGTAGGNGADGGVWIEEFYN